MGNIVLLDDLTINKIAAGEVIERPASVVKEMVENSIDAGSKNITIEIKNGGISFIKITDDGTGIAEDDMEIAFERHATSKIRTASDLDTVTTMGFRGEALASIAAISNVEMISKKQGDEIGHKIVVEGGKILEKSEIGCPVGTTIIVKNLFYNTPVRYKFLKKDYTESGYIEDAVKRIALVNKDVSIKLINSGKTILQTNGSNDFKTIIYSIFGKDIANGIIEANYTYNDIKVSGVVGKSEIARSNRHNQMFFVNGRYIKDKTLTASVEQAYKGLLPAGKFAFVILNLEMDPSKLDVNVHPAKLEVRFQDENSIFKAVYHTIKYAFGKDEPVEPKFENKPSNIEVKKVEIKEEPKIEVKPGMTIEERINAINSLINQITPQQTAQTAAESVQVSNNEPENKIKDLFVSGNIADKVASEKEKNDKTKIINFGNTKISSNTQEISVAEVNNELKNQEEKDELKKEKIENIDEKISEEKNNTENDSNNQETTIVQMTQKEEKVTENEMLQKTQKIDIATLNSDDKIEDIKVDLTQKNDVAGINPEKQEKKDEFISVVTNKLLEAKLNENDNTEIIDTTKVKEAIKNIPEITPDFEAMYKKAFGIDLSENKNDEEKVEEIEDNTAKLENDDFAYVTNVPNESLFEESDGYKCVNYKFIGVAFSTYIIIEIKDDLYLVNQYFASERILFETLKDNYYGDNKDSQ